MATKHQNSRLKHLLKRFNAWHYVQNNGNIYLIRSLTRPLQNNWKIGETMPLTKNHEAFKIYKGRNKRVHHHKTWGFVWSLLQFSEINGSHPGSICSMYFLSTFQLGCWHSQLLRHTATTGLRAEIRRALIWELRGKKKKKKSLFKQLETLHPLKGEI